MKTMKVMMAVLLTAGIASAAILENWNFDAGTPGAALNTVTSVPTGATLGGSTANGFDIQNGNINFAGLGTGAGFKSFTDASYAGATTGVYQASFDMLNWDMTNTDASNTTAQAGFGFRFNDGANRDLRTLARYNNVGGVGIFSLVVTDGSGNTTIGIETGSVASATINVRQVLDMDLGTYSVFYTIGAGTEQTAYTGSAYAGQILGEFRQQFQTINGGNFMQAGDTMQMDNVILESIPEPATIGMLGFAGLAIMLIRRIRG